MWVFFFLFWNSPRSFPLLLLSTKIKDRVLERNKNDEFSPFCNWGSRFGIQGCLGASACLSLVSVLLNNLRMESEHWSLVKLLHHTLLKSNGTPPPLPLWVMWGCHPQSPAPHHTTPPTVWPLSGMRLLSGNTQGQKIVRAGLPGTAKSEVAMLLEESLAVPTWLFFPSQPGPVPRETSQVLVTFSR